jgi:hypothetical protein
MHFLSKSVGLNSETDSCDELRKRYKRVPGCAAATAAEELFSPLTPHCVAGLPAFHFIRGSLMLSLPGYSSNKPELLRKGSKRPHLTSEGPFVAAAISRQG